MPEQFQESDGRVEKVTGGARVPEQETTTSLALALWTKTPGPADLPRFCWKNLPHFFNGQPIS